LIGPGPAFHGPEGVGSGRLIGHVICLVEKPSCSEMARFWILPPAGAPPSVPRRIAEELLAALNHAMPVAVLGWDAGAAGIAAGAILQMAEDLHV
jgi:hypothetical protein